MKSIRDISINKNTKLADLTKQFSDVGGFTAKKVGQASIILKEMQTDKACIKFLSFPSCIMATGTRGLLVQLAKNKLVDVIITTCGTIAIDFIRCYKDFYEGSFLLDDANVKKQGCIRLGNVLIKQEDYGPFLEEKLQPIIKELYQKKKEWNTKDICSEIGSRLNKTSLLYWCWKNKIPVIIPGITDGAAGYQLWFFYQKHKDFKINLFEDEQYLSDLLFSAKKTGALILGGGISKHHTIWWNQFKGGLDYAIQISTAPEWDGSLSGAQTREAISWNKLNEKAHHVTIEGDATVILPIIVSNILP